MSITLSQLTQCAERLHDMGAEQNVPMSEHTSFRIGGPADILVCPRDTEELLFALNTAHELDIPVFCMGNGSNLLVSDDGIEGLVIKLRIKDCDVRFEGNTMWVNAMSLFSTAVKKSVDAGFMGLEWGAGIPGTVGGAVAMNAGAYGGEVKDTISAADCIVRTDTGYERVTKSTCASDFSYRKSPYAFPDCIVTGAYFRLTPDDGGARERMDEYTRRRTTKQPLTMPSAGSVFKRPEGNYAGTLIEKAGLKGMSIGGACVSELHAGFIVNTGGATAHDVISLIQLIQQRVFEMSGIRLSPEIMYIGRQ